MQRVLQECEAVRTEAEVAAAVKAAGHTHSQHMPSKSFYMYHTVI